MIRPATPGDERALAALRRVEASPLDPAVLRDALAEVEAIPDAGALTLIVRGRLLGDLGRAADSARALEHAVELAPESADAHHALGLAYADLGRPADALAAWTAAAKADPGHLDAHFNAAQAHYNLGQPEAALAMWRRALAIAPDDFFVLKKILQAEHAIGEDGTATRTRLLEVWRASPDPAVRGQTSFVFDQFDVGGWHVSAIELLGDPLPDDADVLRFAIEDRPGHFVFTVRVETSAYARSRGTPYVVSLSDASQYRVVDSLTELLPYRELRARVQALLASIRPGPA